MSATTEPRPDDGNEGHGPEVRYEVDGHVATITLNRPHRRNAISVKMLELLGRHLTEADLDPEVRVVLLTGAGKGFCSGLDMKDAVAGRGIGAGGSGGTILQTRHLPTVILQEMDTPVLGVINGAAAGYGFDLALGCDIRLIGQSAQLLPAFAKRAIVPESGGTWYLPRLVGWAKAAELCFRARAVDADEAVRIGLANEAVPDDQLQAVARQWADEIAGNAPLAVRAMKRLFRHGQTEDFASHTHHVLLQTLQLFGTSDFREGIEAFVEKRPARWTGR